jgi:hypothetical protein
VSEYQDPQNACRREMRTKWPGLAKRAITSASAAAKLFCIECMGGNKRDAETCESRDCFLWPVGARAQAEREPVAASPAQKAARDASLAKARAALSSVKTPEAVQDPGTESGGSGD